MRSVKHKYHDPKRQVPVVRDYRRELWMEVAIVVARAENTKDNTAPGRWANQILSDYDKRFGS